MFTGKNPGGRARAGWLRNGCRGRAVVQRVPESDPYPITPKDHAWTS